MYIFKKRLEESSFVACQGTAGAYSHIAARRFFSNPDITYTRTFDGVFNAVQKGICSYGVLPLENSNAGSVTAVYHQMIKHDFYIVNSLKLPISHCLLAKRDTLQKDVTEIYTHEQAALQCSMFIEANPEMRLNLCENTALAAKYVSINEKLGVAAIASAECAALYGLNILASSIENYQSNYTRFILISKECLVFDGSDRISLLLTLEHKPGALFQCLKMFADLGINLTKIESIPIPGSDFEFMFYFDCAADIRLLPVQELIEKLKETVNTFVFLGGYSEIQPFST